MVALRTPLCLAALLALAATGHSKRRFVIPGAGLPSPVDIGLTSKELYSMDMPDLTEGLKKSRPRCGPSNHSYADTRDILACYHYLDRLGNRTCKATENMAVVPFCYAGSAQISGQALDSRGSFSYCSDVAMAVLYTVNNCTREDETAAGFEAANGNGNLIIASTNKKWMGS
ncbi:uncharacterized protein UV8b_07731 [Ustilaginoidea virens]|uniref:Uncharacterized protein n=1 Tax=Ustilaginoidea virens TaxID=1159556 RepID=A0A8E5HY18_USTVR|nr:uncharacterized protein UV8b_07731 [Ustilaginoidea virens]QUC23490.1 hypothetical protein UV8b_07731 [Ustilaginoidea virens]